jgi:hypothetical protein
MKKIMIKTNSLLTILINTLKSMMRLVTIELNDIGYLEEAENRGSNTEPVLMMEEVVSLW